MMGCMVPGNSYWGMKKIDPLMSTVSIRDFRYPGILIGYWTYGAALDRVCM